ncbi:branched-chain amino acid ABC transporter ATP-binding protein/permease [Pararhizobium haloflavum]|uniref:branched-chain amino acid ABC transporter ATP-binding protein/permease n=1 Tax=Pararhizobium haloflavum TaxID=2037914 RepID=UPI000C193AD0|nr:branched-chain amino acid ABC transporter ATP-binding protein/permease [Pararhizobium haloflavum]
MPTSDLKRLAIFAAVVLALPLLPFVPSFWITLFVFIGIASLVALGLVLLTGVGGMTSFGQAAFVGFGAYTTAVLTTSFGWSPWLTLPVSLATTGVAALAIGLVTVRLSGHYLPLGTIAWGMCFYYLFGNLQVIGAHDGISGIPPLHFIDQPLTGARAIYVVVWIAVLLSIAGTLNLLNSRVGRGIRALRSGATAAESSGVNVWRAKLLVFVYAALLAGLAGWLYAHFQRATTPGAFNLNIGIEYLLMAVIGGAGHVYGAILGAAIVVLAKNVLQDAMPMIFGFAGNYEIIVFGVLLILLLQVSRDGFWPAIAGRFSRLSGVAAPIDTTYRLAKGDMTLSPDLLLAVKGATKRFGGLVAVNDVSFKVPRGHIVGLIGPNGAGKSTTFNLVTGVLGVSEGEIHFAGERIDGLTPRQIAARRIARTFQHVKLAPGMSVLENVAIGAHKRGRAGMLAGILKLDRAEERRIFAEAAFQIERVGLQAEMHRKAGELALGQQRLAEIARALCLDPVLLLLDEPAAGLRHMEKQALAALIRRLRYEGMSVLLVEHDMDFVMQLTDEIVVLDFGTKIAEGAPAEIRRNEAVIEAYLGTAA